MSTWLAPLPDIQFAQLFDGRLEKYGIQKDKVIRQNETKKTPFLVGPDGFLEVDAHENGTCTFTRRGPVPWAIYDAITEEFGVELVTEHDHRFWGFATEKEWNDWNEEEYKKSEDEYYDNLVKYVRDEPNGVLPGTIWMIKAEIAKTLVKSDQGLMAPERRDALLEAMNAIYDRDHAMKITLTEQDLAAADMMAARTDDVAGPN
jgi:hypothetical protein